jgi:signal transduction histidine kinase
MMSASDGPDRAGAPREDDGRLAELLDLAGHELREPLAVVSGSAQLLKGRANIELDDASARDIERILAGARLMHERIDDMIQFARAGSDSLHIGEVDCARLLESELPGLARTIEDAGASVVVGDLPAVSGDREKVALVLRNLVSSALARAGGEPLTVELTGRRIDDGWRVSVADDGSDIDPSDAVGLFEPFGSRGAHGGSSSALATCRRLVERHGGSIGYEPREGGGSVLWFTLPEAQPAPA